MAWRIADGLTCGATRPLGCCHGVVTILCDGGSRYQSTLFNPSFLQSKGLPVPSWLGA